MIVLVVVDDDVSECHRVLVSPLSDLGVFGKSRTTLSLAVMAPLITTADDLVSDSFSMLVCNCCASIVEVVHTPIIIHTTCLLVC